MAACLATFATGWGDGKRERRDGKGRQKLNDNLCILDDPGCLEMFGDVWRSFAAQKVLLVFTKHVFHCLSAQHPKDSTEVSFNTGISACEKGGAWQSSLQLLEMMSAVRLHLSSKPITVSTFVDHWKIQELYGSTKLSKQNRHRKPVNIRKLC